MTKNTEHFYLKQKQKQIKKRKKKKKRKKIRSIRIKKTNYYNIIYIVLLKMFFFRYKMYFFNQHNIQKSLT